MNQKMIEICEAFENGLKQGDTVYLYTFEGAKKFAEYLNSKGYKGKVDVSKTHNVISFKLLKSKPVKQSLDTQVKEYIRYHYSQNIEWEEKTEESRYIILKPDYCHYTLHIDITENEINVYAENTAKENTENDPLANICYEKTVKSLKALKTWLNKF